MANRSQKKWRRTAEQEQAYAKKLENDIEKIQEDAHNERVRLMTDVRRRAFEDVKDKMELFAHGEPPVRADIIRECLARLLREEAVESGDVSVPAQVVHSLPAIGDLFDVDGVLLPFK